MINYIMILNNKYSPRSLWSTYSILKKWYKIKKNINIKDWTLVTDLMKALTKNHVVKKSKTFTKKQICSIVEGCDVDDCLKVRLMGVGIGVSYFGLLRKSEVLLVNVEDVTFNTKKNVYQVSSVMRRKTCTDNVSFDLPAYVPW